MSETKQPLKKSLNKLDLEKEIKRVKSLCKTDEGIEAISQVLGIKFTEVVDEGEKPKKPIVALLIPTHYSPKPEMAQALGKVVQVANEVCHVIGRPSISSSVVHWTRNHLLYDLIKSEDWKVVTHVCFLDDDIVPAPDALKKLVEHNVDIAAAACTVRQDPPLPNFRTYRSEDFSYHTAFEWDGDGLINIGAVGTGMMLISKAALEKTAEYYLNCEHEKRFFGMPDDLVTKFSKVRRDSYEKTGNAWWFEFLKIPHGDGEYGEDISFCFKARQVGLEVYVDTSITPGHIGNYPFSIKDFLYYQAQVLAHQEKQQLPAPKVERGPKSESAEKISVIVPTRGRPRNMLRLFESIRDTSDEMPEVVFYIDDDDKSSIDRARSLNVLTKGKVTSFVGPRIKMSEMWNAASRASTGEILMVAGDDIVFKTKGWDSQVKNEFAKHDDRILFVHGDDGYWGRDGRPQFGTHGFLHKKWIEAVGYFLPPYFSADWADTWLNEVADRLGRRKQLPFLTEHMHPLFGKAELDENHKERLERGTKDKVQDLYISKAREREADVEKLASVIEGAASGQSLHTGQPVLATL